MLSILQDNQKSISQKVFSLSKIYSFYIEGHSETITVMCTSQDKSLLGTGSMDRTFRIWCCTTQRQSVAFGEISGGIHSIAFSCSNKYGICGTGASEVKIFNIKSKSEEHCFDVQSKITWKLATVSDFKYIISAGIKSSIQVYNFFKKVEAAQLISHKSGITELLLINDRVLLSGGFDRQIIIWDLLHMEIRKKIQAHDGYINQFLFFEEAGLIFSSSKDKSIKIWNYDQGKIIFTLLGHFGSVNFLSLNNEKDLMVSAADDSVIVWNLETLTMITIFKAHQRLIFFADFLENDALIVSASSESIKIWNRETKIIIKSIEIPRVEFLKIAKVKDSIIVACSDYSIKAWNQQGFTESTFEGHLDYVSYLKVQNEKILVSGGKDGTVRIWNLAEKKQLTCLYGHKRFIKKIAFTKNSKFLVSSSNDLKFFVWKIRDI